MSDGFRILEQRALRNVRALIERLERDDLLERKRQWYWVLIALLPVTLFLGLIITKVTPLTASGRQTQCELDAWNAKAAEFERTTRATNPDLSASEIQKRLEHERPFLLIEARIDCSRELK